MLPDFWNERYQADNYAYGIKPNAFLKEKLPELKRGSILFPAEGEGRNAVYACEQAWKVSAFDFSMAAKEKAVKLANERFVNFQYNVCGVEDFVSDIQFDAIGLFFTHFSAPQQVAYYQKIIELLKDGGALIGELFSEQQLELQKKYNSGGPKNAAMLLTIPKMKSMFPTIDFEILTEQEVVLDEGEYHQGKAHTIRFLGTKKSITS